MLERRSEGDLKALGHGLDGHARRVYRKLRRLLGCIGDLEFNKTIAAARYKVTVTAPKDKKFKAIEKTIEASKLVAVGSDKVRARIDKLPMDKFLAFKLEAMDDDDAKLVEYGNSFAFMLGAPKLITKVKTQVKTIKKGKKKKNVKTYTLNLRFKPLKGASGYVAKIVIKGKVKTIKITKGKKKLKSFMVGSINLPKKGKYKLTFHAFNKMGGIKYYGVKVTTIVK